MASQPVEVVFYVHGVSGNREGRSHLAEYQALHQGIRKYAPSYPEFYAGAEWGWNPTGQPGNSHLQLTDAQNKLGERIDEVMSHTFDLSLNPARIGVRPARELFLYGFGDMFYYVSKDGKQAVRAAVANQITSFLRPYLAQDDSVPISLTLFGHSAGSVVAFDFAFYLFQQCMADHSFISHDSKQVADSTWESCIELRKRADAGQLRIRRLFTFGSPIAPLAMRSDPVVELLADGKQLRPADYGLTQNSEVFEPLPGPRWVNFWDVDDVIGWPVEPLMEPAVANGSAAVKDQYLDVSDLLSNAHNKFWTSKKMHQAVAELW